MNMSNAAQKNLVWAIVAVLLCLISIGCSHYSNLPAEEVPIHFHESNVIDSTILSHLDSAQAQIPTILPIISHGNPDTANVLSDASAVVGQSHIGILLESTDLVLGEAEGNLQDTAASSIIDSSTVKKTAAKPKLIPRLLKAIGRAVIDVLRLLLKDDTDSTNGNKTQTETIVATTELIGFADYQRLTEFLGLNCRTYRLSLDLVDHPRTSTQSAVGYKSGSSLNTILRRRSP
jgi:hypothetical protein